MTSTSSWLLLPRTGSLLWIVEWAKRDEVESAVGGNSDVALYQGVDWKFWLYEPVSLARDDGVGCRLSRT